MTINIPRFRIPFKSDDENQWQRTENWLEIERYLQSSLSITINASDTEVLFMDGTTPTGNADFTWDNANENLTIGEYIISNQHDRIEGPVHWGGSGSDAAAGSTEGIALGYKSLANDSRGIALGYQASVATFTSIVLGAHATATADHQLVIGDGGGIGSNRIDYVYLGGVEATNAGGLAGPTISGPNNLGSGGGGGLTLKAGDGSSTGSGATLSISGNGSTRAFGATVDSVEFDDGSTTFLASSTTDHTIVADNFTYQKIAGNVAFQNVSGTLGFFSATPVSQQSVPGSPTVGDIVTALQAYGLLA